MPSMGASRHQVNTSFSAPQTIFTRHIRRFGARARAAAFAGSGSNRSGARRTPGVSPGLCSRRRSSVPLSAERTARHTGIRQGDPASANGCTGRTALLRAVLLERPVGRRVRWVPQERDKAEASFRTTRLRPLPRPSQKPPLPRYPVTPLPQPHRTQKAHGLHREPVGPTLGGGIVFQ
jgi:hypothetical protein